MAKKTGPSAKAEKTGDNIDADSWQYISGLATKRRAAKVKLTDLVESRKSLEEQLKEEGPRHTKKRMELSTDYVDVLEKIDLARAKLRELADKLDKAIDDANQGKLPGMADEDPETKPATGSELYDGKRADDEGKGDDRPVGRIGREPATAGA